MLSIAAEPLIEDIGWNDLASSSGVVVCASLYNSLKGELMENYASVFVFNDEDVTEENRNWKMC